MYLVTLTKQVRLNGKRYEVGAKLEVDALVLAQLRQHKAIDENSVIEKEVEGTIPDENNNNNGIINRLTSGPFVWFSRV